MEAQEVRAIAGKTTSMIVGLLLSRGYGSQPLAERDSGGNVCPCVGAQDLVERTRSSCGSKVCYGIFEHDYPP